MAKETTTTKKNSVVKTEKKVKNVDEEVVEKNEEAEKIEKIEEAEIKKPVKKKKVATKEEKPAKKVQKSYSPLDTIPCQSITNGELVFCSEKTGNQYYWGGCGDICEITYEDLLFLKSKRSPFLYSPYFVILDDDIFNTDNNILNIKTCFDMISDMDDFLENEALIRKAITTFPAGLKRMLVEEVTTRVRNGSLVNLNVINLLDKVLDINLKMYVL